MEWDNKDKGMGDCHFRGNDVMYVEMLCFYK